VEDLQKKLTKTKGVSPGLFDQYIKVTQGYIDVDRCLSKCEQIGKEIADIMSIWTGEPVPSSKSEAPSGTATPNGISAEAGLHITAIDTVKLEEKAASEQSSRKRKVLQSYMKTQPAGLKAGVKLKDYQLLGLNWLNLLYSKGLSCILADDMGEPLLLVRRLMFG
jgi:SWI/SNF-related matrix-associated actin-dependent regulator 1 of chromatin subfamily A